MNELVSLFFFASPPLCFCGNSFTVLSCSLSSLTPCLFLVLHFTISSSSLLKKIERETWRESGISLIATVTRLMERLLDYRCEHALSNHTCKYTLPCPHLQCFCHRDCMKLGEVDGKKIGCTVSLLVSGS